jgi:hypothetical protein
MSTSNDKIQSSKGSVADEVKDQTETRKDAIKEDLQKDDSLTEKASNIKDDLTADKDQLKSKQAEAGKFDSNDPHFFDTHEKSNVTDDADDQRSSEGKDEARDRLETHKDSVSEELKQGELPNTVFADNGKSREDARWDIYKNSSSEERELEMEDKIDSDKKKLGDWLQDTEEHAIIM